MAHVEPWVSWEVIRTSENKAVSNYNDSTPVLVGLGTGATIGALAGGPVGALVGGIIGGILGLGASKN